MVSMTAINEERIYAIPNFVRCPPDYGNNGGPGQPFRESHE